MPPELTTTEALRILGLPPSADATAVKRAYRRLARELHPDVGGDVSRFHELRTAYDRLLGSSEPPSVPQSRGSRDRAADWAAPPTRLFSDERVDTAVVDWSREVPDRRLSRADPDRVAVLLAAPGPEPLAPVTARSRGPRSPFNLMIPLLDPDLTTSWTVRPAQERGLADHDIELHLRAWSRRARRRLDGHELPAGWTAIRGSSSTTVVRTLHPSRDRRASAVRAVGALQRLLETIRWPLETWFISHDRA